MNKPIVVIVGASGAGKSTLAMRLENSDSPSFFLLPKYTTRPPRPEELHTQTEDIFISLNEFNAMHKQQQFIGVSQPFNQPHWYGITKIPQHTKDFTLVLLRTFVLQEFKAIYPDVFVVHLRTNSDTMLLRMQKRGQTTADIQKRIASAQLELAEGDTVANLLLEGTDTEHIKLLLEALDNYKHNHYNTRHG